MTFDDDFIQLEGSHGIQRIRCVAAGIQWPPPEKLDAVGYTWRRESYSTITDDERTVMSFLVRGARYVVDKP